MAYLLRERAFKLESLDNKIINEIAEAIERFENTVIGAVSMISVSPKKFVAVELNRNIKDFEIKPSIGLDGQIYDVTFSKNVFMKPRTWLISMVKGGLLIDRRR
jgi:DNA integrity scanning protein DisA with diadenylate cyclase activity